MLNVNELSGFGAGDSGIGPHRYWRIHSVTAPAHSYWGFHNIEMRGVVSGADLTGSGTAIYGGATAFVGSVSPCFDSDCDSVSYLYDVTYPTGAWIGYDFGVPTSVVEVFISWFASASVPPDLVIQYSDDNAAWYEAKTFGVIPWGAGNDPICSKAYPWAVLTL